jgi:hypothetical protein
MILLCTHCTPVVEASKSSALLLGVSDRSKVLEVAKLLLSQTRLFSDTNNVVSVKRFYHAS